MSPLLLAELRLLGSTELDTCTIVAVVLSGDRRIEEHLRTPELAPVNSRIRARLPARIGVVHRQVSLSLITSNASAFLSLEPRPP